VPQCPIAGDANGHATALLGPVCPDLCLNKWLWIWLYLVVSYNATRQPGTVFNCVDATGRSVSEVLGLRVEAGGSLLCSSATPLTALR